MNDIGFSLSISALECRKELSQSGKMMAAIMQKITTEVNLEGKYMRDVTPVTAIMVKTTKTSVRMSRQVTTICLIVLKLQNVHLQLSSDLTLSLNFSKYGEKQSGYFWSMT